MDNSIDNKIKLLKIKRREAKVFKFEAIATILSLAGAYTILCVILPIMLAK